MPPSRRRRPGLTRRPFFLFMNCFALPLACYGNGFFEGPGQPVNVGYIIAVDRPGFGFLLRAARFAVYGNADALTIREELFFDTRQVFPAHLDYFPVATALYQGFWLQANGKRNGSYNAQVNKKASDKSQRDNRASYSWGPFAQSNPQDERGAAQDSGQGQYQLGRLQAGSDEDLSLRRWR